MGGGVKSAVGKAPFFIPYLSSLVPPMFGSVCRSKEDSSAVSRARERGRGDEPDAHHPGLFFAIATMLPPRAGAVREVISDE